jgi:hypothetical protein
METKQIDEDQLRVAKLLIAGWVKNWSCLTLFNVITGDRLRTIKQVEELQQKYKFLPSDWFWYFGKNGFSHKEIKKFIADFDRKLSNALWDTEDNLKKLSFASYLATLDSTGIKASSKYNRQEKAENEKAIRGAKGNYIAGVYNKEYGQKMNGTHWNTVK